MAAPLRKTFGLGMLSMFGGEGTQIVAGCTGIVVVAAVVTKTWYSMISDKLPKTHSPQWQAATAKYRQAQKQDPISGH